MLGHNFSHNLNLFFASCWPHSLTWHPAAIGISKIWVHPAHRRAGVARRLTDCARRHTVYGLAVAPADMAFSSPTPEGVAFARKYTGRPDFLIYT